MKLSFDETKDLIDLVLRHDKGNASGTLHGVLMDMGRKESHFYDGVIEHGPFMDYTSERWFDFHRKVPHWRLRDEQALMNKLSPNQKIRLLIG